MVGKNKKRKKSHGLPNTVKVSMWSGKGHKRRTPIKTK